jgi:homoserine kinase
MTAKAGSAPSAESAPVLSATAFAPATVANVGVGFDILGFAVDGVGDRVRVTRMETPGVRIAVSGMPDSDAIPKDPAKNTAGVPLLGLLAELRPGFGLSVEIEKGIPLGSGLGGSAASAVGAVVAANRLLPEPLPIEALLRFALEGEAVASGAKHADNVAPCLFGGLTLTGPGDAPEVVRVPFPKALHCALVHPAMRLDTREARAALAADLPLKLHVLQSVRLATFLTGCATGELALIRRGLDDLLIEPQRAKLIPGFAAVKQAALASGGPGEVLGCTISGAGPSLFALTADAASAARAVSAMIAAFEAAGLSAEGWVSPVGGAGARLV